MILYLAPGGCCLADHIALIEAGLPYTLMRVHRDRRTGDGCDVALRSADALRQRELEMNGSQDERDSEPHHVLHRGDLLRGVPCRLQAGSRRGRVWAEQTQRLRGLTWLAAGASLRGVVA